MPENKSFSKPLISIIVPIYNVEKYLPQCLDSLLSQSYENIEILCIDDGSPDGCSVILDEYKQKYSKIRVYHKPNGGYGSAINYGIDRAHGEYIGFLDPDDFADERMYEILYDSISQHDAPLVKSGWYNYWDGEKPRMEYACNIILTKPTLFTPRSIPKLFSGQSTLWAGLYKLDWLKQNNIRCSETPKASAQDVAILLKAFFLAEKIVLIPNPLIYYRQTNPGSAWYNLENRYSIYNEMEKVANWMKEENITDLEAQSLILKKMYQAYTGNLTRIPKAMQHPLLERMVHDFRHYHKQFQERPEAIDPDEWSDICWWAHPESLTKIRACKRILKKIIELFYQRTNKDNCVRIKILSFRVYKSSSLS